MNNLFEKWINKIPKYSSEYKFLFDSLTAKGGAEGEKKISLGKHFSNNYEFYIYAFFLGLYENESIDIPKEDRGIDFSYAIQSWGSKSTISFRKDFTILQKYIFAALITKTDINFMALEKGEISEDEVVKILIDKMQSITNGGLQMIKEKIESNSNYFLSQNSFLDTILGQRKRVEI